MICSVIFILGSYFNFFFFFSLDIVVFNDGNKKELVSLDGTIPVKYKGKLFLFN